jgi:hypothetical protein
MGAAHGSYSALLVHVSLLGLDVWRNVLDCGRNGCSAARAQGATYVLAFLHRITACDNGPNDFVCEFGSSSIFDLVGMASV